MTKHSLDERGQASLEYLLVGLVLMALMGSFSALWQFFSSDGAASLVESNASHAASSTEGVNDALLF